MEATEEYKEFVKNLSSQGCVIMPDEKSSYYYVGFYDDIQIILKLIKGV